MLSITEIICHSSGILTIQEELEKNASKRAV